MRICFVTPEIFAFGYYGGHGKSTRNIGGGLVKRGIEVFVLTQQQKTQRTIEQIDGMVVLSYPGGLNVKSIYKSLRSGSLYRMPEPDVYHTWDPYFIAPYIINKFTSKSKHLVSLVDPWVEDALKKKTTYDPQWKGIKKYHLTRLNPYFANKTIANADTLSCPAKYLIPLVKDMHNLKSDPVFLPVPVEVPDQKIEKASKPTVCFIARWAPVKRVDRFFELAKNFPNVDFIAAGMSYDDETDKYYRKLGEDIPNLTMPGIVIGEEKNELLAKSWIMVNTSFHEGLPISFCEAAAFKCAILSSENPDTFASRFGYRAEEDDFETGLSYLLENNRWKEQGELGYNYVLETHELNRVIDQHIEVYEELAGR